MTFPPPLKPLPTRPPEDPVSFQQHPLHNMAPIIVLRDGRPVLALGARGGRETPNAGDCAGAMR